MSWFSKIFNPIVSVAAPIAGFAFGGGPLGAAAGGALGGLLTGQGLGGAVRGGVTGGLGGAFTTLGGSLGTVAGTPLAGGVGPTQGTGALGGITKAMPSLSAPLKQLTTPLSGGGSSMFGSGTSPLSSIMSGALSMNSAEKQKDEWIKQIARAQQGYAPYQESGLQANQMLKDKLASGELGGKFTAEDFQADPGYQFRVDQGNKLLNQRLSAGGNYFSGDALKAIQDYGQGMASQEYQNAFNRDMSQQQNLYNMLYGQQGVGASAADKLALLYGDEADARNTARTTKTNSLAQILGGFM